MVDLNKGRGQEPLKKEHPETRPTDVTSPRAVPVQPPARPSTGPPKTRDSIQYPKDIPSIRSLVWFVAGVFFCFALQNFWQPVDPSSTCAVPGDTDVPVAEVPEVAIAVMGATGSGKSTFINLISGSNLGIGNGLRSFTNTVQATDVFHLDGRPVVLIDTPGFDDTSLSDTDVLNMIATFLATAYEQNKMLAGVLYFHRISDFRMTGISRRNFGMFRKLCGDSALQNVVIVTNMWGEVNAEVGNQREAELMSQDDFFKPVIDKGARMARHENTVISAEKIIRLILGNHPLPLRIQEELVKEQKVISETGAGEELNRVVNFQIKKHQEEMRMLKEEMEQAMRDMDEEVRRGLEDEMKGLQEKVKGLQNDRERLASDYKVRIALLRDTIRASEKEKVEMREKIEELSGIVNGSSWNFLKDWIFR